MNISAAQCRAGRALLGWSQEELSKNAQVSRAAIADFELNKRTLMRQNLVSVRCALEAGGIAFIPENGGGAGVRFREIELEYIPSVTPDYDDMVMRFRFRGIEHRVVIPHTVLDDIDRTNYHTVEERALCIQNHFPVFSRAAEEKIRCGAYTKSERIVLTHDAFPEGTF